MTPTGQSGSWTSSLGCWVRKGGETSLGTLLHPPPQGDSLGGWDASQSLSCLLQASQLADNGSLTPSGHPAVIKTELQQLAVLCPAQLGLATDLGYSCLGRSGTCTACFSSMETVMCFSPTIHWQWGQRTDRGRQRKALCQDPKESLHPTDIL